MIVFSKKQRIENPSFPLFQNIVKDRNVPPTQQPLSPRNDMDSYSESAYTIKSEYQSQRQNTSSHQPSSYQHQKPPLPQSNQFQNLQNQYQDQHVHDDQPQHHQNLLSQQQQKVQPIAHDNLEIPTFDTRLQTPSFTDTKSKRLATEDFISNPMNIEGHNWYGTEGSRQFVPEQYENLGDRAIKREAALDLATAETKGQKKPKANKAPSSLMASYLQSLQKENPMDRQNSLNKDNSISRLEEDVHPGINQDDFLKSDQRNSESRNFQQRPPSGDNLRKRPSRNPNKTNTSMTQLSRDPNQSLSMYNATDEDFDIERIRREYENTDVGASNSKDPNRQSNASNNQRVDTSRTLNQRDMRPRDVSSDPEITRDASLTRMGSNLNGRGDRSPTYDNTSMPFDDFY